MMVTMKVKPKVHTRSEEDPDLLVNLKHFPDLTIGDVLEIYHDNNDFSRLLLQVTKNCEELKDTNPLSIEASVASLFHINKFKDVIITKISQKDVKLDLVELLYKDQYYSRSDMWHMRSRLIDTCSYLNMSVQHTEMKANVCEMWAKGEKVMCGYISEDTRIVFRSLTAVVQIFIQMSAEMWEFDNYGDLYFEKAVGGFLCDLFDKWKEKKCTHDVTIVLFSRTIFDALSIENFPTPMRECLQQDHKGRFYEDYYRVVIQNERYEDWNQTHVKLREMFNRYQENVLSYHSRHGNNVPRGYNSMASQGNFLETLNMAINLFEKSYLDHCFDRTGQVAVVITPGAGVFEVDRELCNITKQRTIDCGVGSDLVCVGEQPLHAVPLFKFHNKNTSNSFDVGDDYNIPHWMNHSFYTSRSQSKCLANSAFVPRIKPPQVILDRIRNGECNDKLYCPSREDHLLRKSTQHDDNFEFIDYDEYDAQIFKPPSRTANKPGFHPQRSKSFFNTSYAAQPMPQTLAEARRLRIPRDRHISDNFVDSLHSDMDRRSSTQSVVIPTRMNSRESNGTSSVGCYPVSETSESQSSLDSHHGSNCRPVVGSAGSTVGRSKTLMCLHNFRPNRALINPFAPSRMHFKMTSNRRRWVHAFPINPKGAAVQSHHVHCSTVDSDDDISLYGHTANAGQMYPVMAQPTLRSDTSFGDINDVRSMSPILSQASTLKVENGHSMDISPSNSHHNITSDRPVSLSTSYGSTRKLRGVGSQPTVFSWGITGEQEWSPEIVTGHDWRPLDDQEAAYDQSHLVKPILSSATDSQTFCATISVDWKSLVIPVSLPITTDYFPDSRCLNNDYVQNQYSLIDDFYAEIGSEEAADTEKFTRIQQLFHEMISQRIGQGFQLVVRPKQLTNVNVSEFPQFEHVSNLRRGRLRDDSKNKYYLSIGRIFHVLELSGQSIAVHRFRPRHMLPQLKYDYRYRFQAPDSRMYDVSWTQFCNAKLENYNWNYLDQYLMMRGSDDYGLIESLKYWRSRFLLLPCNSVATKKILDGHQRCDVYEEKTAEELQELTSGFLRFTEMLNSIKRSHSRRRSNTRKKLTAVKSNDQTSQSTSGQSSNGDVKKNTSQITQTSNDATSGTMADTGTQQDNTSGVVEQAVTIPSSTSLPTLVEEMTDKSYGIPLLGKQKSLPLDSFISAEAVDWCIGNVSEVTGITQACQLMQRLVDEGLVCHASGDKNHPFIYGFYIYTFTQRLTERKPISPTFSTDWWEIAIPEILEDIPITRDSPPDLFHDSPTQSTSYASNSSQTNSKAHKYYNLDISKHPRVEWASVRYHANYDARCAFEVIVKWLVATGCILSELISTWARHVKTRTGFHLLPVPVDPFALPHTENSDPLRGPIFVPLHYQCLLYPGSYLNSTDYDVRVETIMQLQDHILKRFGFMPTQSREISLSLSIDEVNQYVHCTGGMFALIPEMRHNIAPKPPNISPSKLNTIIGNSKSDRPSFSFTDSKSYKLSNSFTDAKSDEPSKSFTDLKSDGKSDKPSESFTDGKSDKPSNSFTDKSAKRTIGFTHGKSDEPSNSYTKSDTILNMNKRFDSHSIVGSNSAPNVKSFTNLNAAPRKVSSHQHYIAARQKSVSREEEQKDDLKVGFLWSWNHMSSSRWRSMNTGHGEEFQDKMLEDFRQFCGNMEGRLEEVWRDYETFNFMAIDAVCIL